MREPRKDFWLKMIQLSAITVVFGIGFWQFARAGFDWRAVLDMTSLWVFFLAMASLPVFGFPISVCYIYAGLAFQPLEASITCLAALCVNMSVSYALTHSMFKKPVSQFLERRGWSIPTLTDENQFRFIFLVRTIPGPPFFFQNLTLSLAGIPFWTYLWISLLTQGGIAIGVILCSRNLSQDPFGKASITIVVVLGVLLIVKSVRFIAKAKK